MTFVFLEYDQAKTFELCPRACCANRSGNRYRLGPFRPCVTVAGLGNAIPRRLEAFGEHPGAIK